MIHAQQTRNQQKASALEEPVLRPYFTPAALKFLRGIVRNNRREWFEPRKQIYEHELKEPMLALIGVINQAMGSFSPEHVRDPRKCMMRIYRDVRFSSDKRPYKNHIAAWWSAAGQPRTSGAGYYFHVSAKEVVVAAGVYMPDREQLLAIRTFLLKEHRRVRRLANQPRLRRLMQFSTGELLTRPPKGFPKEHPAMDLLRARQWGVDCTLPVDAALDPSLPRLIIERFRLAAPLVRIFNQPLFRSAEDKPFIDFR